jgi:hypothetical protein
MLKYSSRFCVWTRVNFAFSLGGALSNAVQIRLMNLVPKLLPFSCLVS